MPNKCSQFFLLEKPFYENIQRKTRRRKKEKKVLKISATYVVGSHLTAHQLQHHCLCTLFHPFGLTKKIILSQMLLLFLLIDQSNDVIPIDRRKYLFHPN